MLIIIQPGLEATVQDLGRPGYAHLGVPHGGAADQSALRHGNRLVGNSQNAAGIEFLLGGLSFMVDQDTMIVVTGAPVPVTIDARPAELNTAIHLFAGQTLSTGSAIYGLRSYICAAGGIAVRRVLGSRSTDTVSGIGPPRLAAGSELPIGSCRGRLSAAADVAIESASATGNIGVRYFQGPRAEYFRPEALRQFASAPWTVTADIDRVGARLQGPHLAYATERQLPSEGIMTGSVQVPGSGQPIVLLCNHGTTGGYPIIAVVHPADVAKVAQARPGGTIRFRRVPR